MNMIFKQVAGTVLTVATVFSTAAVMADSITSRYINNSTDGNCVQNCNQNDGCCLTWCNPAPQCGLGYNPSAHLQCGDRPCCGALDNLGGRFDILYWRPCSDGLELGKAESVVASSIGNETVLTNESRAVDPNFKFDTGFRLGLDYNCPSNCWDIALNWIHFHAKANASWANDEDTFVNNWERLAGYNPTEIESRWTLNMDVLDLEFAQKYFVNHCFILRPFIGLRAARIDQGYHVEALADSSFTSDVDAKSDFRGIGPRAGMDVQIRLGCGVSLVGCAAGSLLFGTFNRHSSEHLAQGGTNPFSEFNYDPHGGGPDRCTVTAADLGIGLMFEHCFECCGNKHPFALVFAWEHHAFYDLNHFNFAAEGLNSNGGVNGIHDGKTGDLTTQGLTVSAMIGF